MTVRKLKKNGKWLVDFYYEKLDGTFERHRKQPFDTRKEAVIYEDNLKKVLDEERNNIIHKIFTFYLFIKTCITFKRFNKKN